MNGGAQPDGKYPIRQVFAAAFPGYSKSHVLSPEQISAARCIMQCKTGSLGYNYYECPQCGHVRAVPRSCGNRNCPNCQAISKAAWLEERKGELIGAPYYHIVGTLPHELNPLLSANRKALYELLHKSMGKALVQLSNDPKYLGATPGIVQVIHTWDQLLHYHVHVHCVVSGGGLTKDKRLVTMPQDAPFFMPVKVVAAMYKGKFMAGLKDLRSAGKLLIPDGAAGLSQEDGWKRFIDHLYRTDWNVYIKQTFNGNGNAIEYLSRYANRIAISNSRILSFKDGNVTFSYTDRKDGGRKKEKTITAEEFIRRYIQHVVPKGFQKIRYYGFLNNSTRKKNLAVIFEQQGGRKYEPKFDRNSPTEKILSYICSSQSRKCPCCGKGNLTYVTSSRELRIMGDSCGIRPRGIDKPSPKSRSA